MAVTRPGLVLLAARGTSSSANWALHYQVAGTDYAQVDLVPMPGFVIFMR